MILMTITSNLRLLSHEYNQNHYSDEWEIYKRKKRKKLEIQEPSIIASYCVGTFIYSDMNLRWCSPTINLMIEMPDFVKLVEKLDWYLEQDITFIDDPDHEYPVGMLGEIKLYFVHYKTPEEALEKWETRKRRIDPDNLYIIGCEKDGCTYETIQRFDKLPYKNKAILTKQEYPEFNSAWYLPGFEDCEALGTVTNFKDQFSKRRYMDDFDYITFLNNGVKN